MASYLEGKLAKIIAKAFKGKLMVGTIAKPVRTSTDEFGDPVIDELLQYSFTGIRQSFDALYREQASIPELDIGILVLLQSVPQLTSQSFRAEGQQYMIHIDSEWFQVRKVLEIDPANASVKLDCYRIADPTAGT